MHITPQFDEDGGVVGVLKVEGAFTGPVVGFSERGADPDDGNVSSCGTFKDVT